MRHHLTVHFAGKALEEDALDRSGNVVLTAGTVIDADAAEKILAADVPVIRVRMDECEGVEVMKIEENNRLIESLADRISGRCPLEDVVNPQTGEIIAKKNVEITDEQASEIEKYYDRLKIRSMLTCHSAHGVCAKCYGRNLATGRHVEIGEAVGIIAAQSIGEPGTQLTMRTFHTGGVASAEDITQGLPRVEELFEARKPKGNAIISKISGTVSITSAEDNPNVKIITISNDEQSESEKIPVAKRSLSRMDSTSKLAHVFSKATSTRTISSKYWVSRLLRITSSTKSRRFTAARALKSTISTSKSSLTRCSVRSRSSNRAILAGSRAKSSTLSHTAA